MADLGRLMAKTLATLEALNKTTERERQQAPSAHFVEDYCNLRRLTIEAVKDLEPVLPPEVEDDDDVNYVELLAYTQQIFNQLNRIELQRRGGAGMVMRG